MFNLFKKKQEGKEEEINDKAEQIFNRLASIQEKLDVRFPLYIFITKCDKICGFREFWDCIDDLPDIKLREKLKQQILGYCNQANLDDSFDPTSVDESIHETVDKLKAYRLGLLKTALTDEAKVRMAYHQK